MFPVSFVLSCMCNSAMFPHCVHKLNNVCTILSDNLYIAPEGIMAVM